MFYKKIDLRKLYENTEAESLLNDDMPAGADKAEVTAGAEMPEGSVDVSQEEETMAKEEAKELKKQKNAGRMYAWPISQEVEDELRSLAAGGSGVWSSSEPLKLWVNGKDGEPAMIGEKPVYLRIKVLANKADRHNPVQSEADREYVEYTTSAEELVAALDTAVNVTNSVRVSVTTPFLKSGKSTEHSLEMWLDHESQSQPATDSVSKEQVEDETESMDSTDIGDGKVNVDMELQMENPGTAAGIGEANAYFYDEFEVERMIGSILENAEYQLIRKSSAGNARWLLDVTNDKAYSVTSEDMYKQLYTKLKISGKSTPIEDAKVDAAVKKGGNKDASSFLKDVTPAAAVKPSSSTVDGTIADVVETRRSLKRGRKGDAVKELQQFLNIDDDGIFGKGTEAAVKAWQKENGLEVDGVIGPKSAAKIVELMSADKDSSGADAAGTEEENANTSDAENKEEEVTPEEETKEEPKEEEEKEEEKDLEEMSLEELEAELESTKDELKDAKKKKRKDKKAERKKKRLIRRINRKKKRTNESVDQDSDGDNDFDDVRIARYIASGMSKEEAIKKVKGSKKNPVNEATVFTFDDFIKRSNGLQDSLNDFFNGKK